jgi:hypothetical protein
MFEVTLKLPDGVTATLRSTGRPLNWMVTGVQPAKQKPVPVITTVVPVGPDGGLTETRGIGAAAAAPVQSGEPARAPMTRPISTQLLGLMATII